MFSRTNSLQFATSNRVGLMFAGLSSKILSKTFQQRQYTDRSFRLATVDDLYAASKYQNRLKPANYVSFRHTSEVKPRDVSKQIVIDLSHEQGYRRGHIEGAINLPIEKFDFTRLVDVYGGISRDECVDVMKNLGISDSTSEIILYDNSGLLACRLWFVLRYFGFSRVRILDGGWRTWLRAGYPVSEETVKPTPAQTLELKPKRTHLLTKPTQMAFDVKNKTSTIVDTRRPEAYNAYHILDSINVPSILLMEDAMFSSVKEIREICQSHGVDLDSDKKIMLYSDKGLSACVGLFALSMAGCDRISVYDAGLENWKTNFDDTLSADIQEKLSR